MFTPFAINLHFFRSSLTCVLHSSWGFRSIICGTNFGSIVWNNVLVIQLPIFNQQKSASQFVLQHFWRITKYFLSLISIIFQHSRDSYFINTNDKFTCFHFQCMFYVHNAGRTIFLSVDIASSVTALKRLHLLRNELQNEKEAQSLICNCPSYVIECIEASN